MRYGIVLTLPLPCVIMRIGGYMDTVKRPDRQRKRLEDPEYRRRDLLRNAEWRRNNPDKIRTNDARRRVYKLREKGWTEESYETIWQDQGGLCAICCEPIKGRLCADHKHVEPPIPRGLLCHACNKGLGFFKDDPAILDRAADYLRRPW